jgi:hypothetical protein
LLLGWSHHSKNYAVIDTKYPYLKWQWIFCFWCIFFVFPLTPTIPVSNLTIYIWVTWLESYKKQELLTLHEHLGSPPVFGGVHVLFIFLVFCVVLWVCFSSCVLYAQCCQCLWIVHSWFPPLVFSNVYLARLLLWYCLAVLVDWLISKEKI